MRRGAGRWVRTPRFTGCFDKRNVMAGVVLVVVLAITR